MERSCKYHFAQITVFSEHICNRNQSHLVTDINFLTKMQKRAHPLDWKCPFAIINLQKLIVTVRLRFLGLCQLIDTALVFMLCYIITIWGESPNSVKSSVDTALIRWSFQLEIFSEGLSRIQLSLWMYIVPKRIHLLSQRCALGSALRFSWIIKKKCCKPILQLIPAAQMNWKI